VHVVAEIGRQEGEAGGDVWRAAERHVVAPAFGPDVRVVRLRVVSDDIPARIARRAIRRHRLLQRARAAARELAEDRRHRKRMLARRAVIGDPLRRAGSERDVVRKRRMADRRVVGREAAQARELVDVRRGGCADDRAVRVILEEDPDHVRVVRRGARPRAGRVRWRGWWRAAWGDDRRRPGAGRPRAGRVRGGDPDPEPPADVARADPVGPTSRATDQDTPGARWGAALPGVAVPGRPALPSPARRRQAFVPRRPGRGREAARRSSGSAPTLLPSCPRRAPRAGRRRGPRRVWRSDAWARSPAEGRTHRRGRRGVSEQRSAEDLLRRSQQRLVREGSRGPR